MKFVELTELSYKNKHEILALWNREYPEKLSHENLKEFENYLESLAEQFHVLIVGKDQKIKGWYFDFKRDNERWFAIILDAELQGKGFGTRILNIGKEKEPELNGWVIDHSNERKKNGDIYRSPLSFYLKNGFKKIEDSRLELGKISAVKIKWTK